MNTLNLLEFNADSNIREWYHTAYPTDDYYTAVSYTHLRAHET